MYDGMNPDDIVAMLDKMTTDGVGRMKITISDKVEAGTVTKQYHHGRCDVGSPWATGCDIPDEKRADDRAKVTSEPATPGSVTFDL